MIPHGFEPEPLGKSGLIIGGSSRFDMYGPKFRMGRASAVRMGYGNKEDGKITANPGPPIMVALEVDQEFMSFVSIS
ncbi:hypothetical protein RDABS01_034017 [Bienertia sinuspersici]